MKSVEMAKARRTEYYRDEYIARMTPIRLFAAAVLTVLAVFAVMGAR